jgi:LacI family transcriptional regulator
LLVTDQDLKASAFTKQFKQWLDKNKPDAILTPDNRVVPTLEDLKLRIPRDIAVAATTVFDIPVDAGINQNSEEIGRVAVETLISLMNSNDRGKPAVPRRILIKGTWMDGSSLPNLKAR